MEDWCDHKCPSPQTSLVLDYTGNNDSEMESIMDGGNTQFSGRLQSLSRGPITLRSSEGHVVLTRVGWRGERPNVDLVRVDHAYRTTTEPSTPEALESFTLTYTLTMRRAQSTRHVTRASVPTIGTNDLGVLRETAEESKEVALRRQLLDKSKENDKVRRSFTFVTLTPI